jgi:hypothetical protein
MRHRIGRKRGNVVAFTQPARAIDTPTDIKYTLNASAQLPALLATLATRRREAVNAFLRAFAADLTAAGDAPGSALIDTQVAKFAVWESTDAEFAKRIDALNAIQVGLKRRIGEFAKTNRDDVVELLTQQIAALRDQPQERESDQAAVNQRIAVLQDELDHLPGAAKPAAAAKRRKK